MVEHCRCSIGNSPSEAVPIFCLICLFKSMCYFKLPINKYGGCLIFKYKLINRMKFKGVII